MDLNQRFRFNYSLKGSCTVTSTFSFLHFVLSLTSGSVLLLLLHGFNFMSWSKQKLHYHHIRNKVENKEEELWQNFLPFNFYWIRFLCSVKFLLNRFCVLVEVKKFDFAILNQWQKQKSIQFLFPFEPKSRRRWNTNEIQGQKSDNHRCSHFHFPNQHWFW